jgi:hypothetical protein
VTDGGPDLRLDTAADNQSVSQFFTVRVNAAPAWQNPTLAFDVDGNGQVEARDVLALVNYINQFDSGPLPTPASPPPYLDVNGDQHITPLDVLMVINFLNHSLGEGEGTEIPPVRRNLDLASGPPDAKHGMWPELLREDLDEELLAELALDAARRINASAEGNLSTWKFEWSMHSPPSRATDPKSSERHG